MILSAVAVWLIVTSTTQKSIQIGILTGLWGLMLGALSMFGARRTAPNDNPVGDHDTGSGVGSGLAVRGDAALDRADDAAGQRDFEARLEALIQREISGTVNREVAGLRSEIAQLRQDLLDKVGGQLRLERIETTRLIGSDLEALHHEVRQLKVANETSNVSELLAEATSQRVTSVHQVLETAKVRRAARPGVEVDADAGPDRRRAVPKSPATVVDVVVSGSHAGRAQGRSSQPAQSGAREAGAAQQVEAQRAEAQRAEAQRAEAQRVEAQRAETEAASAKRAEAQRQEAERAAARRVEARRIETERAAAKRAQAEAAAAQRVEAQRVEAQRAAAKQADVQRVEAERVEAERVEAERVEAERVAAERAEADDPFASLPRLRPFTDFPLDPSPPVVDPDYTGRRRRNNGAVGAEDGAGTGQGSENVPGGFGRHGGNVDNDGSAQRGRRRRAEERDSGGDLLATLLAREAAEG